MQFLTRASVIVGGVTGAAVGVGSYRFLLANVVMALTLAGLYALGSGLLVAHVRTLETDESDGGSWWVIAFGGVVGTVLIVVQELYRPVGLGTQIQSRVPDEEFVPVSMTASVTLWLVIFGVALVSLNLGIGFALADVDD